MSDKPEEKPTVELPAVPKWAVELTTSVKSGFLTVNARLDSQDTKLDKVVTEGIEANVRLDRIEVRMKDAERGIEDLESRIGRTSERVRGVSESDLEQDAQLAQERAAREELAAKVDAIAKTNETQLAILSRLDNVAKNPLVKTLAAMLLTALVTWLASHGIAVK
jgi:predicted  nucleic acid-binding Zn-ribbon protein